MGVESHGTIVFVDLKDLVTKNMVKIFGFKEFPANYIFVAYCILRYQDTEHVLHRKYSLRVLGAEIRGLVVIRDERAAEVRYVKDPGRPRPGRLILDVERGENGGGAGDGLYDV